MSLMEAKFGSLCQNHPHIIQTYDYHIDDETEELFVFMEKPEGSMNLQEYLNIHAKRLAKCKDQMLRERFAKEFVRQMISAIGTSKILAE
jgi:serine/threonine protein kinase